MNIRKHSQSTIMHAHIYIHCYKCMNISWPWRLTETFLSALKPHSIFYAVSAFHPIASRFARYYPYIVPRRNNGKHSSLVTTNIYTTYLRVQKKHCLAYLNEVGSKTFLIQQWGNQLAKRGRLDVSLFPQAIHGDPKLQLLHECILVRSQARESCVWQKWVLIAAQLTDSLCIHKTAFGRPELSAHLPWEHNSSRKIPLLHMHSQSRVFLSRNTHRCIACRGSCWFLPCPSRVFVTAWPKVTVIVPEYRLHWGKEQRWWKTESVAKLAGTVPRLGSVCRFRTYLNTISAIACYCHTILAGHANHGRAVVSHDSRLHQQTRWVRVEKRKLEVTRPLRGQFRRQHFVEGNVKQPNYRKESLSYCQVGFSSWLAIASKGQQGQMLHRTLASRLNFRMIRSDFHGASLRTMILLCFEFPKSCRRSA